MQKQTLHQLLSQNLYQIPSYQRGYAWEEKQWKEFAQDVDALVEDGVSSHYTGTVVTFEGKGDPVSYHLRKLKAVDVVDGQQRLTTSSLYLSIVMHKLIHVGAHEYEQEIPLYLYSNGSTKLTLNNDTQDIFHDLIKFGSSKTTPVSTHQVRLADAHRHFKKHIDRRFSAKGSEGIDYLKGLYEALTGKLVFTFYTIEEESEIGMTFELMNSRGKGLSVLELLKNYLMHWVYRNASQDTREPLTKLINRNWKDAYTNIGSTHGLGKEDQCLRVAWTLYCSYTPKNWEGYSGFKGNDYIPLRNFRDSAKAETAAFKTKDETQKFLERFANGLALVSKHYAQIVNPSQSLCTSPEEFVWLTKIHHTGNIANFLPLMTAARIRVEDGKLNQDDYIDLLEALECYAYRVFLFEGKRSNAGKSKFHRWADDVFKGRHSLKEVISSIYRLLDEYSDEVTFLSWNTKPQNWYGHRNLLRYTLYEYELHLLETEGKGKAPSLSWDQLMSISTIEHVLPQTPAIDSDWLAKWTEEEMKLYMHDLGNLVLTQNNSNYLNFEFDRKKGQPGQSPSYSHSDIRQERDVSGYADWTSEHLLERRKKISRWINERWKSVDGIATPLVVDQNDDDDDDAPDNVS
jgi:hypothetical protein